MHEINSPSDLEKVLSSSNLIVLDFWAPWCGPCRMLAPTLERFAAQYPEVAVAKVNVDENKALASAFSIRSIPTLVFLKDGTPVANMVGGQPLERLQQTVDGLR